MAETERRVALITGCGKENGIGAAIARRLARDGFIVAVSDVAAAGVDNDNAIERPDTRWEGMETLVADIKGQRGQAMALLGDVSTEEGAAHLINRTIGCRSHIDGCFSSPSIAGNDLVRQSHRPFVRLDQQGPRSVESLTLTQRAKRHNGLSTRLTPAHPRALQALRHQCLARCFDDARSDWKMLSPQCGVVHPVTMRTEIRHRLMQRFATWIAGSQATQGVDHFVHAVRRVP